MPTDVWGFLIILLVCPLLGGLPLIDGMALLLTGQRLSQVGTGNVSVSAAFYHGGKFLGILAVLSEAFKGIAAVLLARTFFPGEDAWIMLALTTLVIGRFAWGRGAGTTNVVWGYVVFDAAGAFLIFLLGGMGFTLVRERQAGKLGVLGLVMLITVLRHPHDGALFATTATLCAVLALIYRQIPDDLDLSATAVKPESRKMFRFFRGDRALLSLEHPLEVAKAGQKAATLSQLWRWGYPIPPGWVLPPGDDPAPLVEALQPSADHPLIVRSSAIGEDSTVASAAGLYDSIANVTSQPALAEAILRCQASYHLPAAMQYRKDRNATEEAMAVLVQQQVKGVFSGVAFSRDPIMRQGDAVVIEALPGTANRIVSGQVTPEQYRVWIRDEVWEAIASNPKEPGTGKTALAPHSLPDSLDLPLEGQGDVPPHLIQQVAYLARHLEQRYHGIPQDIEWSYDGRQLWLLQSRPITTLLPIWTRKIAAEVIPGLIRPLTWSINRPLTCGVWGEIFTVVLGDRAQGLDFTETATLHHSAAYFNASLLGDIFLRMGLPPESLEFLTRGAKFSKPPARSTVQNIPGLLRLLQREWRLEDDFNRDDQQHIQPMLNELSDQPATALVPSTLLVRIDEILDCLKRVTYYSILSPLSLALRRALLKVDESHLDNSQTPEVASVRSLQAIAIAVQEYLPPEQREGDWNKLTATLATTDTGRSLLKQVDQFLMDYGYMSDVATDIAVPTWRENPQPVYALLAQLIANPSPEASRVAPQSRPWKDRHVQRRLNLKGRVTAVYNRLLAELRWCFVALEQDWIKSGWLTQSDDIFFLTFEEIQRSIRDPQGGSQETLRQLVAKRRSQFVQDQERSPIPRLVYGNDPPFFSPATEGFPFSSNAQTLRGIGASPGSVEGEVMILRDLQTVPTLDRATILVVPYTDSGWAPLLARAGGLIAEVGGRLSHGAIIAREYGIPAVMDIHDATRQLQNGQRVRVDGQQGIVEIL